MKKVFLLLILIFYSIPAFPQWWVKGGNVIWPYGNVDITKGNLNLDKGNLSINQGNIDIFYGNIQMIEGNFYIESGGIISPYYRFKNDSLIFEPYGESYLKIFDNGSDFSSFKLSLSDYGYYSGNLTLNMNPEEGVFLEGPYINFVSSDLLLLDGKIRFSGTSYKSSSSVSDPPTASELTSLFGSKSSGFIGLLRDSGNNKLYLISTNGFSWYYTELNEAL